MTHTVIEPTQIRRDVARTEAGIVIRHCRGHLDIIPILYVIIRMRQRRIRDQNIAHIRRCIVRGDVIAVLSTVPRRIRRCHRDAGR